ncbi:unnamed protein product [Medioppia subpectinata]|uniref:Nuclear receptor domain-containing protein n=1 Tax=Medioppia subpectinata TaxID=1979941 RepID=A0A7R9PWA9_9ACAR|nr:unnamed protein product [Medioppia subpectinata]CAG2102696.1 unnamed protein product [Medioppia subpectinata]
MSVQSITFKLVVNDDNDRHSNSSGDTVDAKPVNLDYECYLLYTVESRVYVQLFAVLAKRHPNGSVIRRLSACRRDDALQSWSHNRPVGPLSLLFSTLKLIKRIQTFSYQCSPTQDTPHKSRDHSISAFTPNSMGRQCYAASVATKPVDFTMEFTLVKAARYTESSLALVYNCSGFFRRSIQQKIQYRPCTKNQQCSILRINRNRCQYCRLKKCIAVGMSRDGEYPNHIPVRFGRVPKREKAKILAAMQKVNANSQQKALCVELEDENRLLTTIIKAHEETCDYTRDKVAQLIDRARTQPVYAHCPPQMRFETTVSYKGDSHSTL